MEPTHSSPFNPDEDSPAHKGSPRPSSNDPISQRSPDPLLSELRMAQADPIWLQAAISLICADVAASPKTSRSGLRTLSEGSPEAEQLEGLIRGFLWPAYGKDTSVVREQFETLAKVVQNAAEEHFGGDTPHQAHSRIRLHSILYAEAVSCLTSNTLSAAARDLQNSMETTIVRQFHNHIEQEIGRLEALNRASQLPEDLRQKAAEALVDRRGHEAGAALKAITARLDELRSVFVPLTQQAIGEFSTWIPEQSDEYLTDLADYVKARFALPFRRALSDIRHDTQVAISSDIGRLETAASSGASGSGTSGMGH